MGQVYHKFEVNEEIEVVPSEINMWTSILNHVRIKYRVVEVSMNRLICCAGHPQHLVLDTGDHASGSWFDSNCDQNRSCPGGQKHRDTSGWRWENSNEVSRKP